MLSEVFLTTLSVSGFAFLGAVLGVCYKSKCKTIECCCIKVVRDVDGEEVIDRAVIDTGRNVLPT
jgi:hypothetical protein